MNGKTLEERVTKLEELLAEPEIIFLKGFALVPRAAYRGVKGVVAAAVRYVFHSRKDNEPEQPEATEERLSTDKAAKPDPIIGG